MIRGKRLRVKTWGEDIASKDKCEEDVKTPVLMLYTGQQKEMKSALENTSCFGF